MVLLRRHCRAGRRKPRGSLCKKSHDARGVRPLRRGALGVKSLGGSSFERVAKGYRAIDKSVSEMSAIPAYNKFKASAGGVPEASVGPRPELRT